MDHLRCCKIYFGEKFQVTALFTKTLCVTISQKDGGKNEVCKRKLNTDRERMEDDNE